MGSLNRNRPSLSVLDKMGVSQREASILMRRTNPRPVPKHRQPSKTFRKYKGHKLYMGSVKVEHVVGNNGSYYERGGLLKARQQLKLSGRPLVFANIGRGHEDYGMTPAEHAFSKANRTPDSKAKRRFRAAR
jgi:hypothetical protein